MYFSFKIEAKKERRQKKVFGEKSKSLLSSHSSGASSLISGDQSASVSVVRLVHLILASLQYFSMSLC